MKDPNHLAGFGISEDIRAMVPDGLAPARVTAVNRTNCEIESPSGPAIAELTGRLRFEAESSLEYPSVGDWVAVNQMDDFALITEVLERSSVLRRRRPGTDSDFQLLAANVDVALILQGCDHPVNVRRLERFAAMASDGDVHPQIVFSKVDLLDAAGRGDLIEATAHLGPPLFVSSLEEDGTAALMSGLVPAKTYVLLGPSGAGKTTLLNRLTGAKEDTEYATGAVRSGDSKGRHTTTRRHLVVLPGGALLIDTPGVRELGMADMSGGIEDVFESITTLAEECRFRDCAHDGEAGCAVQAAIDDGQISEKLLDAFHKLEREAAHFERSAAERRQKDKALGKLYKSVIQGKKDRR
jgi:ribosome biogenesis GTPase